MPVINPVRVTAELLADLKLLAAYEHRNVSEMLRECIRREVERWQDLEVKNEHRDRVVDREKL